MSSESAVEAVVPANQDETLPEIDQQLRRLSEQLSAIMTQYAAIARAAPEVARDIQRLHDTIVATLAERSAGADAE